MNGEAICISDLGASTVVGRDPWSAAAAVRAGIDGFIEHPFMIDAAGKPMYVAVAPWLEVDLAGAARFESLLFPAIDQALGSIGASPDKATRACSFAWDARCPTGTNGGPAFRPA
jgi:3-oxoacyl-[acyl-carrier-protein] synthase-1